jgi:peptidoglycan/xylan/chitin deacetylase (PgdA/CDA1 family)
MADYTLALLARVALAVLVALIVTGVITYSLTRSRTFQLAGELVSRVETTDKVVALTLDDGPTREHTQDVLDILKEKGVRATFYLSGRECEQDPAMLKAIIAAGHELGNHSYSGRRMVFLSGAAGVRPGSIVLMHGMYDSRESSQVALPRIIEQLSDAGYRFVTVSELLALRAP